MKRVIKILGFIFAIIIITSCEELSVDELIFDSDIISIEYGTSFGECLGYCQHSIKITSNLIEYEAVSIVSPEEFPDIHYQKSITTDEWDEITDEINFLVFRNLDEVIGCPDCTDGGAEWIDIETSSVSHKVTFEYMNEPEEVTDLINELRELLDDF